MSIGQDSLMWTSFTPILLYISSVSCRVTIITVILLLHLFTKYLQFQISLQERIDSISQIYPI